MMTTDEWERCCFWRAVESVDEKGVFLAQAVAMEATVASRGELESQGVNPVGMEGEVEAFLVRRARRLDDLAMGVAKEPMLRLLATVRLPVIPGWVLWAGGVGALVLGFGMTSLGNERELNLLALPLVGLLVWNAVVMLGAVVMEFWPRRGAGRVGIWRKRSEGGDVEVERVAEAFATLTGETGRRLLARRVRVWLHVGAAVVALGSMVALFARGWSREYRVVWESTILDGADAEAFLGGLFAPAAAVFGPAVPVEELAGMRRGEGLETVPGKALPWLKLYAGTLCLGVMLPRLGLALLTRWRGRSDLERSVAGQGWGGYALRLLRGVEGSGNVVRVVAAGGAPDEKVRGRWREWLGRVYGGCCEFTMEGVNEADQDDWVEAWRPEDGRVVVVFFLAATPEEEVQRAWLMRVREALVAAHYEPEVVVLLDAAGLATRWSGEKRRSREQLWRESVSGLATRTWVGDERGLTDLNSDMPQKGL